jgi:hypothetical protein
MLSVTIRSKCFEAIAGRNAKIAQHPRLVQKSSFLSATFWMSAGNFRLRRTDQINSASESAKL